MAHQPKTFIYIEFKFKMRLRLSLHPLNACVLMWLVGWHGEMLLHQNWNNFNNHFHVELFILALHALILVLINYLNSYYNYHSYLEIEREREREREKGVSEIDREVGGRGREEGRREGEI
jgi:hypothetical protein